MLFYKNYIDDYSDKSGVFIEKSMHTKFHHDW